jgi:formylglycine-generating enzyme required for sulfatase activity
LGLLLGARRPSHAISAAVISALIVLSAACSVTERSNRREPLERAARHAEIQRLTDLLAQRPADPSLLRRLGKEHWAIGELDEAERFLERALGVQADRETQLDLLSVLYARAHYVAAADLTRSLIAHTGNAVPPWVHDLARTFDQAGSRQRAPRGDLVRVEGAFVNSIGMRFVEVPGGSFVRGDDRGARDRRPARSITLSPYFIGQYEVTAGQFQRFLDDTQYRSRLFAEQVADAAVSEYPAAAVSWRDAEAFAIWLSTREQAVYRLPTEAEWEFAARGPNGYREPWGNDKGREQVDANWGRTEVADLRASIRGSMPPLRPVGSFARDRSAFGAFDMAGNVREWCLDEYDVSYYSWSPATNPFGPIEHEGLKVLRGGSWNDPGRGEFALARWRASQNQAYTGYGFRIVREVAGR